MPAGGGEHIVMLGKALHLTASRILRLVKKQFGSRLLHCIMLLMCMHDTFTGKSVNTEGHVNHFQITAIVMTSHHKSNRAQTGPEVVRQPQ
jgi:hypothetical protein